jgi:CheY-like chemotaxis protein
MSASNFTVLVVEDNPDNLLIYSTILRHSGFTVFEARDGQEGLETARREHPGLILMDVSIPVVDGLEVTRRLKADPETRDIPIVALTAHALVTDEQRALDAGCDGYIAKPAEPRAVVATVKGYLGDARAALRTRQE